MGRPSTYKPEYCETLIAEMAEGASITEVAGVLKIGKQTLYEWFEKYPELADAKKRGEQLSEAWWMGKGRKNLENGKFQAALWYMNMKNRFGWRDKQDHEISGRDGAPLQAVIHFANKPGDEAKADE